MVSPLIVVLTWQKSQKSCMLPLVSCHVVNMDILHTADQVMTAPSGVSCHVVNMDILHTADQVMIAPSGVSCHVVNMDILHTADQVMTDCTQLHLVWGYSVDTKNPEGQTVKSV